MRRWARSLGEHPGSQWQPEQRAGPAARELARAPGCARLPTLTRLWLVECRPTARPSSGLTSSSRGAVAGFLARNLARWAADQGGRFAGRSRQARRAPAPDEFDVARIGCGWGRLSSGSSWDNLRRGSRRRVGQPAGRRSSNRVPGWPTRQAGRLGRYCDQPLRRQVTAPSDQRTRCRPQASGDRRTGCAAARRPPPGARPAGSGSTSAALSSAAPWLSAAQHQVSSESAPPSKPSGLGLDQYFQEIRVHGGNRRSRCAPAETSEPWSGRAPGCWRCTRARGELFEPVVHCARLQSVVISASRAMLGRHQARSPATSSSASSTSWALSLSSASWLARACTLASVAAAAARRACSLGARPLLSAPAVRHALRGA